MVGSVRKSISYNTYRSDSSSWSLTALWVAFSKNADISNDESGMANDILLKPRVEATEQMTQNWTFRSPRISESAKITSKWQVCSSYSMFPSYFSVEGTYTMNLLLSRFIDNREKKLWKYLTEMYQVLLLSEFILDIDRKIPRQIFLVDFELG